MYLGQWDFGRRTPTVEKWWPQLLQSHHRFVALTLWTSCPLQSGLRRSVRLLQVWHWKACTFSFVVASAFCASSSFVCSEVSMLSIFSSSSSITRLLYLNTASCCEDASIEMPSLGFAPCSATLCRLSLLLCSLTKGQSL